ncbi:MAG: DMT family transporter [Pseudomonadota bacterium]
MTAAATSIGNRPLAGIGLLVLGMGLFTINDAISKWLTVIYPVSEFIFVRGSFAVLTVLIFVAFSGGLAQLRLVSVKGQIARSAAQAIGTLLLVSTLGFLPLATVTALLFASPIMMAALSGPMLAEHVSWQRWSAILLGFAGVLIMVQPGTDSFQLLMVVPLLGALALSIRDLLSRSLARTETATSILFMGVLGQMLVGLVAIPIEAGPVKGDWRPIEPFHFAVLAASGCVSGCGQFLVVQAFRNAEASLLAPFKYSTLLWAVAIGFVFWGEIPSPVVLVGAGLVMLSGLYMGYMRK